MLIQHVSLVSSQANVDELRWDGSKVRNETTWKEEISRLRDVINLARGVIDKAQSPEDSIPTWKGVLKMATDMPLLLCFSPGCMA